MVIWLVADLVWCWVWGVYVVVVVVWWFLCLFLLCFGRVLGIRFVFGGGVGVVGFVLARRCSLGMFY